MKNDIKILCKDHGGLMAVCFLLVFFSVFGQSVFFGVYLPDIRQDLGLSKTMVGNIYAAATIISSVLLSFSGKGLDHIPLRHFVAIVLGGLGAGCFILSQANSVWVLFAAFLLLRHFGQGLMGLSSSASINRYLEKNRGKAVSITSLGAPFQMLVFPVFAVWLGHHVPWHTAWIMYGGFIWCILLPAFWLFLKSHQTGTHARWVESLKKAETDNDIIQVYHWTRGEVLKHWRIYAIIAITTITPFVGTVIFFYQAELAASLGMTHMKFATAFPFMTFAAVVSSLGAGAIIDSYGERPALIAFPVLYATGLYFITHGSGIEFLYIGMMLVGSGGGIMATTGGPLLAQLYGTKYLSSVKSVLFSCAILASALSPSIFGILMDNGYDIRDLFRSVILYCGVVWILAFPICRGRKR